MGWGERMNNETKDQIASIMLQFGNEEQQKEALKYCEAEPKNGTWVLRSPNGYFWEGNSPLNCVKRELESRVPLEVRMERLNSFIFDEEESEREFQEWWGTSKYTQVIFDNPENKQIAFDAWKEARK